VFLARHLEPSTDLAWWRLWLAAPGFPLAAGIVTGAMIGALAAVMGKIIDGVVGAVIGAVLFGLGSWAGVEEVLKGSPKPVRGIRWRPPTLRNAEVMVAMGIAGWVFDGAGTGAVAGPLCGFMDWIINQRGAPLDLRPAASPAAVLAEDRRTGIAFGGVFGVSSGVLAGFIAGPAAGAIIGAVAGLLVGVLSSFVLTAWPSYAVCRIWLALHNRLPWALMDFLADAHRRGVLQQAGPVYQFRHIGLQRRLAAWPHSYGPGQAPSTLSGSNTRSGT
jgi:hypothetical protein